MVDDLGYIPDDRILERLPNIRRVWIDGGMRFINLYGETPLCCPGRANILTGQHTLHHGVVKNDGDLLDPADTIAPLLQDAGYHTLMVGKYLNNYEGPRKPSGWDRVLMVGNRERYWIDGRRRAIEDRTKPQVISREAVRLVAAAPRDRPLFAWLSSTAPHRCRARSNPGVDCRHPLIAEGDQGDERCAGIPDFKPPGYSVEKPDRDVPGPMPDWPDGWPLTPICESLLSVDRMVGGLVEAQSRRARPAVFIFISDNGMSWGWKGYAGKHVPTSTRLSFYVAGAGVPARSSTDALASSIDIAPTLARLAGTRMRGADGNSLVPVLRSGRSRGRAELLEIMASGSAPWAAIRTPRWHFVRWDAGERELYDVRRDPWETSNRFDDLPRVASDLEERLDALVESSRR